MGSHSLLQGTFPIQGSNPGLRHCRQILNLLSHQRSPSIFPLITTKRRDRQAGELIASHLSQPPPLCSGATRAAVSRAPTSLWADLAVPGAGLLTAHLHPPMSRHSVPLPSCSWDLSIALCNDPGWFSITYHRGSTTMADLRSLPLWTPSRDLPRPPGCLQTAPSS